MYNILIANEDDSQRTLYSNYLNEDKNLNVISVANGTEALNKYNEINPSVFILDVHSNDSVSADIINKLSSTKKESKICNIILTANPNECIFPISNTEKIYRILFKPFENTELKNTINDICNDSQIQEIDELSLKALLLNLKFNINSLPTKYLIEAIYQCYYNPHLNLKEVTEIVAYKFNISKENIKSAFRNSLRPINIYRETINKSYINLFDETRNITPKYFLEVITTYLHTKNQK